MDKQLTEGSAVENSSRMKPSMNNADHERPEPTRNESWKYFRRGLLYFALLCAAVWISLYALYVRFPYIQSGSDTVATAKRSHSLTHPLFDTDAQIRILVFGDSKTLAAFNPRVFDDQLAQDGISGKAQSFNEGLPGERRFVVYLEQLLASGIRPTHILAQFSPVEAGHEMTWSE